MATTIAGAKAYKSLRYMDPANYPIHIHVPIPCMSMDQSHACTYQVRCLLSSPLPPRPGLTGVRNPQVSCWANSWCWIGRVGGENMGGTWRNKTGTEYPTFSTTTIILLLLVNSNGRLISSSWTLLLITYRASNYTDSSWNLTKNFQKYW